MQMEVLDWNYHQFFLTTNSLGRQQTTSQFIQPLTPQMIALVAAPIHAVLSESATGRKLTVMCSQDKYWGKFSLSTVIDCISAEPTELINYRLWVASYPPPQWCFCARSATIGTPQSLLPLLSLDFGIKIVVSTPNLHFDRRPTYRMGAPQSPCWPQSGAPEFHSRLFFSLPFLCCSAWMGSSTGQMLLNPGWHSLAWLSSPQFHSTHLHHHWLSPCPPSTPHQALHHS